jgi:hypothetical protein
MLITDFSAGELSPDLFGRIDLPQYFKGVSSLYNFDIIPTGGITRRNGMKLVRDLPREGRLIPFIVNRDNQWLLYFIPGFGVRAYRINPETEVSYNSGSFFYELTQINELQYAQNGDSMIIVHEDRAPVEFYLSGDTILYRKFTINYNVKAYTSSEGFDISGYDDKPDEEYDTNKYLKQEGEYPRAVSFFNGRLVFAGTKNHPQRLFFSRVNDYHDFSTKKTFVTEQREYTALTGAIVLDEKNKLKVDPSQIAKLNSPARDYIVDSPKLFPVSPGEIKPKIVEIKTDKLIMNREAALSGTLWRDVESVIKQKKDEFLKYNKYIENENADPDGYVPVRIATYVNENSLLSFYRKVKVGASRIKVYEIKSFGGDLRNFFYVSLPSNMVQLDDANPGAIEALFDQKCLEDIPDFTMTQSESELAAAGGAKQLLRERARYTMKYVFQDTGVTTPYYDYGDKIYDAVEKDHFNELKEKENFYLVLYTSKTLVDSYPSPDDGFTFEIASDMRDNIRWICRNKHLVVGTENAEWIIPQNVHATAIEAFLNSRYGSDKIQATTVGDGISFFQTGGKSILEYHIPMQDGYLRAVDLALLDKETLFESGAKAFDFASSPYTRLFVLREDDTIVTLLYDRESGVFAWGRVRTRGGIKSLAILPGPSGYDDVFFAVKIENNYYLQRLTVATKGSAAGAPDYPVYLDSYKNWTGDPSGYASDAVVYDENENKTYPSGSYPPAASGRWIGYPFESGLKSMPVIANNRMKPNIIKNLVIRFRESGLPRVVSLPNNVETAFTGEEPFDGVKKINFPGAFGADVFFLIKHSAPTPCRILAVNAEVN